MSHNILIVIGLQILANVFMTLPILRHTSRSKQEQSTAIQALANKYDFKYMVYGSVKYGYLLRF